MSEKPSSVPTGPGRAEERGSAAPVPESEALRRLRATLEALPDILFVVDREGRICDYHAPRPGMCYVAPEEFLGRRIPEVLPEPAAGIVGRAIADAVARGHHRGSVYSLPTPGGEQWFEISIAAQGDARAADGRLVAIVRDITDRQRAMAALRESEERFAQSARQSRTYLWEVDAEGLYTYVSPVVEDVLGHRPEELVGRLHFHDLFPAGDREALKAETLGRIRRGGEFRDYENPRVAKDGSLVWVVTSASPLRDGDGGVRGYRGSDTDVTARRRIEEELRESEARGRAIDDNLPVGMVYEVDTGEDGRQRRFTMVSQGVERLHGVTAAEARGDAMLLYGQMVEEDRRTVADLEAYAVATTTPFSAEIRFRLPTGKVRWGLVTSAPRRLANRHLVWDGIEVDITLRKRMEEALQASEAQYRLLHETMRDAFVRMDMKGRILEVNQAYLALTGYSQVELYWMTDRDLTPKRWHAAEARIVEEQILARGYSDVYQKEYIRKDGAVIPVELRTTLIRDGEGRPAAMWATLRDIGARLRTERALVQATSELDRRVKERTAELEESRQALARSEAQFREMAENIQEVFWLIDASARRVLYASPAFVRIWGKASAGPVPTIDEWQESIHPDDRKRVEENFARGGEGEDPPPVEYRILRPDGAVRWIEDRRWAIRGADGRPSRVAGVIRDNTDRRRLEAEILKAAELERLRIGRDLHDSLGQALTGIGYLAEAAREELSRQSRPEAAEVGKLAGLIEQTAAHAHAMARGLLLVDLKRGGLAPALQELASRTQELFGAPCRYEGEAKGEGVDEDVAIHLYRIAQEAATNAAKHGGGASISIGLYPEGDGLRLTIRDAGKGMPEKGRSGGMGLDTMRYRAGIIGATFWIDSRPGEGTAVNCRLSRTRPFEEAPP